MQASNLFSSVGLTWALLGALASHTRWPDPNRFVAPLSPSLGWWGLSVISPVLNQLILWQQGIVGLRVQGRRRLKDFLQQPGPLPRLLVSNHNNFTDPQVFMAFQWRHCPHATGWMAGIEPMEGWLPRLILTTNGTFSVDRGTLDRPSLQYAQQMLKAGQRPLVLFPEGEAFYRHQHLADCQPGAAQLLAKTKDNNAQWLAINMAYTCWQRDPAYYRRQVVSAAKSLGLVGVSVAPDTPMPDVYRQLIEGAVSHLASQHGLPGFGEAELITTKANRVVQHLLTTLIAEHLVAIDTLPEVGQLNEVMALKNRVRSVIVRRLRVPKASWLTTYQAWLKRFAGGDDMEEREIEGWHGWLLGRIEVALFGQVSTKSLAVRVAKCQSACDKRLAEADIAEKVPAETRQRWHEQLNWCRQAKLLAVLAHDATLSLDCPEDWDNVLYKVRLLLTNKHYYTGPKTAVLRVGQPYSYSTQTTSAQLAEQLTQQLQVLMTP